ncbi:hypothetical protein HPB52_021516 [Rhipicephalus sanguineus]|uniref:Uncharacterized protein n=1 Tax=Rhipicephalus sanguineus TaxID=34632 RepID=A0A9D4TBS4_RHISA|nr:hypothetical protein HPB52_021516 [Rhipicephalus sanguineus]
MERTEGRVYPTDGGHPDSVHGDTFTARDLLQVLQEKAQLLSTLLERVTAAGAAQPQLAPTFQTAPRALLRCVNGSTTFAERRYSTGGLLPTRWKLPKPVWYELPGTGIVRGARKSRRGKSSSNVSVEPLMQERVQQLNESTTAYFYSKAQFERIERERREIFGSRNRSLVSPSGSECGLPTTREFTSDENQGTDRRLELPPVNQHGERKCNNCNVYGAIARDCPEPKRPLKCQRCQATDHTQCNCKSFSRNESNVVREALPYTGAGHVLLKEVIFNNDFALVGLIDTGSSGCLSRASAAARCGIEMISIDGTVAEKIPVLVVPDDAQCVGLLVGRTFTDLPFVTYAEVGSTFASTT